jgi:glycerol-3-phosphate dehydrogenase
MEEAAMETDVLIIGGGVTGTGIARDLALRGIPSILVEKGDINAGASGGNHGLLHSGARYVSNDVHSARECMEEGRILRKVAPQCIDDCGGMFVAVQGDDENYVADFPEFCEKSGLSCTPLTTDAARELEPELSSRLIAAYGVEDGAIDPFMLSLENMAHAKQLGAKLFCHTRAVKFIMGSHGIETVLLEDTRSGKSMTVHPQLVINAGGAWAGQIAAMAGASLNILCSMGTLLVTQSRICNGVVNRLRPPADADILVPGGTVSIIGTTSRRVDDPDKILPTVAETDCIVSQGAQMIPFLEQVRYIRAYSGVRPLVGSALSPSPGENSPPLGSWRKKLQIWPVKSLAMKIPVLPARSPCPPPWKANGRTRGLPRNGGWPRPMARQIRFIKHREAQPVGQGPLPGSLLQCPGSGSHV